MPKLLIVLASQNFRDTEYITPRAIFEQQGIEVQTTSTVNESIGRFGYKVQNDLLLKDVQPEHFDGIFFVGGLGSLDFEENKEAKQLTKTFQDQSKTIGAICAAPRNFLSWGILRDKKCTGHNWDNQFPDLCEKHGAIYKDQDVVIDKNIITANGPEASEECANTLVKALKS